MELFGEVELQNTLLETCGAARRRVFHNSDSRKQVRGAEGYELVGDILCRGYPDLTIGEGRDAGTAWAELKGPRGHLETKSRWSGWTTCRPTAPTSGDQRTWRKPTESSSGDTPGEGTGALRACRSCWACSREEILKRVGVRRRRPAGPAGRRSGKKGEKHRGQ